MGDVLHELQRAGFSPAYWRELGWQLKPPPDLDVIEADYHRVEDRLEKVIVHWKNSGDSLYWETLARAVAQCRHGGINVGNRLLRNRGLGIYLVYNANQYVYPYYAEPLHADEVGIGPQQHVEIPPPSIPTPSEGL